MTKSSRKIGISLSYVYFALNTLITVFLSAFIIRTVGKTDYGVYQSISAFISYLVLLEFGTSTIMSRNISLCKKDGTDNLDIQKNVSTIWTLSMVFSGLICIVSVIFWLLIDKIYANTMTGPQIEMGKRLFIYAVIRLIATFLTQTLNGLIIGFEYYVFSKMVSLVNLLLRTALLVVLLTLLPNVEVLAIVDAALAVGIWGCSFIFCLAQIKVKFVCRYFDYEIFKLITPLAFAMLLQTLVTTANGNVDKFLLSVMMSPEDVAVYSIAMMIFGMFSSIATLPVTMFMPQIAKNMRNGMEGKELTESLVPACRLNIIITGLIAWGFVVVGRPFIRILYGSGYSQAWLCAVVVIIPMFMNMFNAIVINVIDVLRKRHVRSLILMGTTAMNIVLTVVGILKIGMLGAALATGLSLIIQTILLNIYYQKKIGLSIGLLIHKSFSGIAPAFCVAAAFAVPVQFILDNIYWQFFVGGVVFVLTFVSLLLIFGLNPEEKEKIKQAAKRIMKY